MCTGPLESTLSEMPLCDYFPKQTFILDVLIACKPKEEVLCRTLDEHGSMPAGFCAQNIESTTTIGTASTTGDVEFPRLQIEAWLAPKVWCGSSLRQHRDGALTVVMPGVERLYEQIPEGPYELVLSSSRISVTRPLLSPEEQESLQAHQNLIAVYNESQRCIDMYRLRDDTDVCNDIASSLCVPVSDTAICYFEAVSDARVELWRSTLTGKLRKTYRVLCENTKFFSLEKLLFLLLCYYCLELGHITRRVLIDSDHVSVIESKYYGKKEQKELRRMVHRLLLFVHGKELLDDMLLTAFAMTPVCREKVLQSVTDLSVKEEKKVTIHYQ